ncbi:hypothetical protein FPZ11_13545 [Humibacter ginsenosidimutans]|uniref:Uncharacterized protein n=1 Tax=Humibacter ginsenosidimutans TaxID=2599293 RepID=A0A5B8M5J6_9MICO|nr:hypothetical protein FPZ11_13545 [Humibacter ginsenosidimutans]
MAAGRAGLIRTAAFSDCRSATPRPSAWRCICSVSPTRRYSSMWRTSVRARRHRHSRRSQRAATVSSAFRPTPTRCTGRQ